MTPAVNLLKKKKIAFNLHPYDHDPAFKAYGEEAADKLNISQGRIFKTLIAVIDGKKMVVAMVPVAGKLDMKLLAKAFNAKKAAMAPKSDVERTTGYLTGGVSPLGQKKRLPAVMDKSAFNFKTIYVSAGKRGLQVSLSPHDLKHLTSAQAEDIARI